MYRGLKVAVVVPAYKEQEHIISTIDGIPDFIDMVIVIDDASPDATGECARTRASERVIVETLPKNRGVGGAIIHGHKIAMARGADVSVVMAGDDQMDPRYLPALLDPLADGNFDFSKGNRFFEKGSLRGMPAYRVVGNAGLSMLTKVSTGYWHIFDPQNGYTAITTAMLKKLPLDKIEERYDFENDLLIWLSIFGARVTDVNIPARYGSETSHIPLLSFTLRVVKTLTRGLARRLVWKFK